MGFKGIQRIDCHDNGKPVIGFQCLMVILENRKSRGAGGKANSWIFCGETPRFGP